MKTLVVVFVPNGVGKSTVCGKLLEQTPQSAYLDAEWCRMINPFPFTPCTLDLVARNMTDLLANYLNCPEIRTGFFPYGLHGARREIWERVLTALRERCGEFRFCPILLLCGEEENIRRMQTDGRDEERIRRAVQASRSVYADCPFPAIDVTCLTPTETAGEIQGLLARESFWNDFKTKENL